MDGILFLLDWSTSIDAVNEIETIETWNAIIIPMKIHFKW